MDAVNDLISRQAAIEAVHEEFDECLVWDESGQKTADEFETIINRLPSAQSEQRWIPCSERLPITKDDYIITVKDKYGTWTDYVEWSAYCHWWGYDDDAVIAWMPLPEPYKGEES